MITILYVDDESALLEICKIFLEKTREFSVDTASDAPEALQKMDGRPYDAVVSDYQMSGMDGIALLKEVRVRYGDIPFILFTGRGREDVVIEAINNGADFYLQKGGDPRSQFAELAHKIRQAVGRRAAESARRESEERYRLILQNANDAVFVHEVSEESPGRIIEVNDQACRMLGYTRDELLARLVSDIDVPEQRQRIPDILEELFARGRSVFSTEHLAKDGRRIPVEVSVRLFELNGKPTILSMARDVSERQRSEQALENSRQLLADIISFLPDPTFAIDTAGRVITWNKAIEEMTGVPASQMLGKGDHEYALPFYGERRPILIDLVLAT
ncbi:MAG: PAS domain S-box protein, partial [Methanobacteriota archaeon]